MDSLLTPIVESTYLNRSLTISTWLLEYIVEKSFLEFRDFYTRSVSCTVARHIPFISPLLVCKRSIRIISDIALRGHLVNLF